HVPDPGDPVRSRLRVALLLATLLALLGPTTASTAPSLPPDTLEFMPLSSDSTHLVLEAEPEHGLERDPVIRPPYGEGLLTERDRWRAQRGRFHASQLLLDYNRVDRLRLGLRYQFQVPEPMAPRLGARVEYAFGRDRTLYGFQLEQPVVRPG